MTYETRSKRSAYTARNGNSIHGMTLNLAETLVVKDENVFLMTPRDGGLPLDEEHAFGLWYRDCRFLSAYCLLLNGERPVFLQASDALGTAALHGKSVV